MHAADEEYRIQQQDRQEWERQQFYRPGWDDILSVLDYAKSKKEMLIRWASNPVHDNIRDAVEQADSIKSKCDEIAAYKKWCLEIGGMTEPEYDEFMIWHTAFKIRKKREYREAEKNHIVIERG